MGAKVTVEWEDGYHRCVGMEEEVVIHYSDKYDEWIMTLSECNMICRIIYCPCCGRNLYGEETDESNQ